MIATFSCCSTRVHLYHLDLLFNVVYNIELLVSFNSHHSRVCITYVLQLLASFLYVDVVGLDAHQRSYFNQRTILKRLLGCLIQYNWQNPATCLKASKWQREILAKRKRKKRRDDMKKSNKDEAKVQKKKKKKCWRNYL